MTDRDLINLLYLRYGEYYREMLPRDSQWVMEPKWWLECLKLAPRGVPFAHPAQCEPDEPWGALLGIPVRVLAAAGPPHLEPVMPDWPYKAVPTWSRS